ncbi:MAG: DUF488 domain-containing protein [Acidobacteria bacterium]|nr:DUF488 domain-containing protein [Acidobacteriota bacterium]
MEVYSVGFTKKTAEQFFGLLKNAGIRRLLDVRLNNVSQLAGFAKRDDLQFFLRAICDAEYIHEPLLAPTQEMLDAYKKRKGSWAEYATGFLTLMRERRAEQALDKFIFSIPTVLLCSEPTADHCHRRLVLEYLKDRCRRRRIPWRTSSFLTGTISKV